MVFRYPILDKKWVLNPYDRDDSLAIDPDGLLCQSREPQKWQGARCNHGVFGKGEHIYKTCIFLEMDYRGL